MLMLVVVVVVVGVLHDHVSTLLNLSLLTSYNMVISHNHSSVDNPTRESGHINAERAKR